MTDSRKDLFDRWRDSTTIKKDDRSWIKVKKVIFRLLGILLLILLSPLLLILLLFTVLAAF